MHSFLRTRLCRVVSVITAFTLSMTTVLSTASVAYAAEAVSSSPPASVAAVPAPDSVPATVSPTVVRELTEKRTANATHYLLSDGTVRAEIQQAPVRFKDKAGAWRGIDTNLLPADGSGTVRSASTEVTTSFGAQRAGTSPVRLTGEGYSVGIDYLGGVEGAKLAMGNQVVYPNVEHDTALAYEARGDGIKETVLLSSADAPSSFRFALDLEGLQMRRDFAGAWGLFRPEDGLPTLALAPLVVFDSSENGAGDPAVCADTTMTVTPAGDVAYVTYEISRAWMQDPARVFPIRVDPTITLTNSGATYGDTYVASAYPGTTYWSSTELKCGYYDSTTGDNRAYVRFDLSSVPDNAFVIDTNYKIHQFHQYYVTTPATTTYLRSLTNSFSSGTTWNTQSSVSGHPEYKGPYIASKSISSRDVDLNWDVDATVQRWLDGSVTNNGFMSYQSETSGQDMTHWRKFRSEEYSVAADRPTLMVYYSAPGTGNSGVDKTAYAPGDVVTAIAHLNSSMSADINAIKLSIRGVDGATSVTRGEMLWTKTAPGAGRVATACSGSAGGYVSYDPTAPGAEMLELVPGQSSATILNGADGSANYVAATFAFKLAPEWGDVQANDLVITGYMDATDGNDTNSIWCSGAKITETNFGVTPLAPVVTGSDTTASAAWFTETDPDGDGLSTDRNDTNASGRGTASLEWEEASGAATYRVYLFDGTAYRAVATTTANAWDSAGGGLYPTDTQIAALSAGYTGNPFTSGTGLDLRDDPTPLYAKTAGTSVDGVPAYFFKVTAKNSAGETALSTQPTVTVQLASRTKRANEAVAHTTYDLGSVAGDSAQAELDSGALTLSSTDLAIDSYGPFAGLSRTYRSDVTSSTCFGAGWRFDFEQNVAVGPSGTRIYTDEGGERHTFSATGVSNTWAAPHSMVATLTWSSTSSTYALALKGGDTLTFDGAGRLSAETDRHGLSVTYAWTAPGVVITAANGHQIRLTTAGMPARVTKAEYSAGGLTRQVDYDAAGATVTRHLSTSETSTVAYSYDTSSRIRAVSMPGFAPGGVSATWGFTYSGAQLQSVHYPHPASTAERVTAIALDVATASATVSYRARVELASADSTVTETYRWDPVGRPIAHGIPAMSVATRQGTDTLDYAPSGSVRRSITAAGVIANAVTDVRGNEVITSDAQGHSSVGVYDQNDDLASVTGPSGSIVTCTYSSAGDPLLAHQTLTATQTAEASRTFDTQGRLLSEGQLIDASTGARAYTTYEYEAEFTTPVRTVKHGVVLSSGGAATDLVSTCTLNDFGEVTSALDDAGVQVISAGYDLSGRVVAATDAAGATAHYSYDALDAVIETSRTAGTKWADWTSATVDPTGLVLTEQSFVTSAGVVVSANTTTHLYDGSGAEIKVGASSVGTVTTSYDAKGDAAAIWVPGVSTATTSTALNVSTDADGREVVSQVATGSAQATAYTPGDSQIATFTPPTSASMGYEYDAAGNLVAAEVPVSSGTAILSADYDLAGRRVRSVDASGNITVACYDLLGRVTSQTLQNAGRSTTATYNTLGWILARTDPDGVVARVTYDPDGRPTEMTVSAVGATDSVTRHSFDASGNETLTVNPDGTQVATTFDPFGRAVRRVEFVGGVTVHDQSSAIDETGRTTETSDSVSGVRSTASFATSATDVNKMTKTMPDATMTVTASAAGIEGTRTLGVKGAPMGGVLTVSVKSRNGAQIPQMWKLSYGGVGSFYRTDVFDGQGRMLFQMDQTEASYKYDPRTGLKTSERVSDWHSLLPSQETTYTYTDAARLASATRNNVTTTYAYDPAGQITRMGAASLSYSEGRIAASTTGGVVTSYTLDARGRRTRESSPSRVATYTWDAAADRLVGYSLDRAPLGSPDVAATFAYDASGQRSTSVVTSGGVTTTSNYLYEGLQLTRLSSTTGSVTTTLTYLYDELARPLAIMASFSDTAAVYTLSPSVNAHGDVRGVVDMAMNPIASWTYDAWGNVTSSASAATTSLGQPVPAAISARIAAVQPLRYAGYAYDSFSGLYYCSQRYYDPATAQFISRDPVLSDAEGSAYQYCGGDPVNKTDPSGLRSDAGGGGGFEGTAKQWKKFIKAYGRGVDYKKAYKTATGHKLVLVSIPKATKKPGAVLGARGSANEKRDPQAPPALAELTHPSGPSPLAQAEQQAQKSVDWYAEKAILPGNKWYETALYSTGGVLSAFMTPRAAPYTIQVVFLMGGAAAARSQGYQGKIDIDQPHPGVADPHVQVQTWQEGVPGSGWRSGHGLTVQDGPWVGHSIHIW